MPASRWDFKVGKAEGCFHEPMPVFKAKTIMFAKAAARYRKWRNGEEGNYWNILFTDAKETQLEATVDRDQTHMELPPEDSKKKGYYVVFQKWLYSVRGAALGGISSTPRTWSALDSPQVPTECRRRTRGLWRVVRRDDFTFARRAGLF